MGERHLGSFKPSSATVYFHLPVIAGPTAGNEILRTGATAAHVRVHMIESGTERQAQSMTLRVGTLCPEAVHSDELLIGDERRLVNQLLTAVATVVGVSDLRKFGSGVPAELHGCAGLPLRKSV
jgi:hypothetical protein